MPMKLTTLVIAWVVWSGAIVYVHATGDMAVSLDSPACKTEDFSLVCDYTNYPEMVRLEGQFQLPVEIQNVRIEGARRLQLSEDICVNITLVNVDDVVVRPGFGYSCISDYISLVIRNSTVDGMPIHVNDITLEHSVISSLVTNSYLKRLIVINTHVQILNVNKPFKNGQHVSIINSTVETFQRLQLYRDSDLYLKNSSLAALSPMGLVLSGAKGHIENCFIDAVSHDSIILSPKTNLSFDGLMGKFTVMVLKDNPLSFEFMEEPSIIVMDQDNTQVCPQCDSYLGGFIACMVLFLLTFCVCAPYIVYLRKLINHIDRQLSNPDIYDYRKDSKFHESQIIQQKDGYLKETSAEEKQSLLDDVDMEQYQCLLENTDDLNKNLISSLHAEKLKYQENIAEIRAEYETKLEKLLLTSQQMKKELENSRKFEIQNLEAQYEEEFNTPTMLFWEKVKDILEKAKAFNKELIEEKYKHLLYNARVHDDIQKLQERVNIVRINKDFIIKLTTSLKEHIAQWPSILTSMRETHINSNTAEQLFMLLENLVATYQSDVEQNYDHCIKEQDNRYLSDSEEQRQELANICSNLRSNISEQKEHLLLQMAKDLESKLPWTKKYSEEVENLYSVREQLLDTKLDFEIKKIEDRRSELQLKLVHLNVILDIQQEYMKNLEKITEMSVNSLNLCARTLRLGVYDEDRCVYSEASTLSKDGEKQTGRRVNRPGDLFMDRYAQA